MRSQLGTRSATASATAWRNARDIAWFLGCVVLAACADDPTTGTVRNGTPVRLSLSTGVVAAPGAVVDAHVTFTPTGSSQPITIARDSIQVSTGEADESLDLLGDVAPCVAAAPTGSNCQIDVHVRLTRNGVLLDENTQRLAVTPDAERLTATPVQLYEVASISLSPTSVTGFQSGDSVLITATPLDRSGATVSARTTAWTVVSGGVNVGASGLVRAVQAGSATVRASIGGRTQDLALTVLPPLTATVAPVNATGEVLIESSIGLTFSENVNAASVTAATVVLTRGGIVVPASRSVIGRVVTITPTAPLSEFQTAYVVTVTSGLTSTLGTRLATTLTSNFTTIFWDPAYYYRLTTNSIGPTSSLDVDGNGFCTMASSGPSLGQAWFFLPILGTGHFTMHNGAGGVGNGLEGADAPTPCFIGGLTVLFSGMLWKTTPAPTAGSHYLQNQNFGVNKSLSTLSGVPEMHPTANTPSQFWTFTRLSRRP